MEDSKTSEKPLSPEIAKLTEKLAADPKSRLFVPLAEEYIKSGMLEEAQSVLEDGLKIHPNFTSAKTTLGKVYFEKGQMQEAKTLFEALIAVNPDNYFAHRRLARIYHEEGRTEDARKSCNAVLAANPKDEEMNTLLESINRGPQVRTEPAGDVSTHLELTAQTEPQAPEAPAEITAESKAPEATPAVSEPEDAGPFDQTKRIVLDDVPPAAVETAPSPPAEPEAPPQEVSESVAGTREESPNPEPAASGTAEEKPFAWSEEKPASEAAPPAEGDLATESLGDLYIKQGYYDKGIEIYRKLLARDPSDTGIRRKLEETESLISILSKGENASPKISPEPVSPPEAGPVQSAEQEAPRTGERRRPGERRVKRLEAWLESLRKGQRK
jgi:tetratricopeptide (TPR) repeat protein